MGSFGSRRALAFMLLYWLTCPFSQSLVGGFRKVRGVNLGGWLVVERWIKPSLFDGIPNGDMLDGTQVQFKSVMLQKFVSAANGGGSNVTVDRDVPSWWETFKIWRVSENMFHFRCYGNQFLTSRSKGNAILATADIPTVSETFIVERNDTKVHIKLLSGNYLQASEDNELTTDYHGKPGWDDNAATFEMVIYANNLHGDFQLANGYGQDKAREILMNHWDNFVTAEDFSFLSEHGINTVRIPVGWWIVEDPDPPPPFIGGTLAVLDRAFSWAQVYNIRCIIDLHAAPGSQNGMEHSASRDGSVNWPSPEFVSQSLDAIEFLSARYADNPALLGIELLNEPSAAAVPIDILLSYYKIGYQKIRNYSSTAYVVVCQRIGNADPMELYEANIGDKNVVVDVHYYNLFDAYFNDLNPLQNMQFIYNSRRPQLQALNSANGPLVFIGEWVNEWNVTNASRIEYQIFGSTQLEVYGSATFGWSYWTLKSEEKHWDFEWSVKNKYLVLGLFDLGFSGPPFTWRRGFLFQRLDRFFGNACLLNYYHITRVRHLSYASSDHNPILLSLAFHLKPAVIHFKFLNIWSSHPTFKDLIKGLWLPVRCGNPWYILWQLHKKVTTGLKQWNHEVFGNIHSRVSISQQIVLSLEAKEGISPNISLELTQAHQTLLQDISLEEDLLKQKAHDIHFTCGDRNSKYFHAAIKSRLNYNSILQITSEDGRVITENEATTTTKP